MISRRSGDDIVDRFHAMRNAADSPMLFALDGQEMLDLERLVEDDDRTLVGVMHSHIDTSPYPSPTDVRDIGRFDPFGAFHHVIASLRHAEPVLRSFTILGSAITEEPICVVAPDLVAGDEPPIAIAARLPQP